MLILEMERSQISNMRYIKYERERERERERDRERERERRIVESFTL